MFTGNPKSSPSVGKFSMGEANVAIWSEPDPAFWASAVVLLRAASKLNSKREDLWVIQNFIILSV